MTKFPSVRFLKRFVAIQGLIVIAHRNFSHAFKRKSGFSVVEMIVATALMSVVVSIVSVPLWKAFVSDRALREVQNFSDAVSLIKYTIRNPRCGSATFVVSGDQGEELLKIPDPPTSDISLLAIRSGEGTESTISSASHTGIIRKMTLKPINRGIPGADSDFDLKKYQFILEIVGAELEIDGQKKTLTQNIFLRLEADPANQNKVAVCERIRVPPVAVSPTSKAPSSFLTYNRKNNSANCTKSKLLLPWGLSCATGFISTLWANPEALPNGKKILNRDCTISNPGDESSVNCWGLDQQ